MNIVPHTVVAFNPAHYISTTEEFYEENKKYNLNTKGLSAKEKKALLLAADEEGLLRK